MYNLTARIGDDRTVITGIGSEAEVQQHVREALTAHSVPFPDTLTSPSFAARLAVARRYHATFDDVSITVSRAD